MIYLSKQYVESHCSPNIPQCNHILMQLSFTPKPSTQYKPCDQKCYINQ